MPHCFSRLGLLVCAALFSPGVARADLTWGADGSGGTGAWDTSALNWYNGTNAVAWPASSYPYTGAESAIFGGTGGTVTIDSSSTIAASHLTFNSAGYTITGSYLYGASTGLTVTTNADATISSSIYAVTSGAVFTKDGSGTLTVEYLSSFGTISLQAGELIAGSSSSMSSSTLSMANAPGVFLTLAANSYAYLAGLTGGGSGGGIIRASAATGTSTLYLSGGGGTFAGQLQDNGSGKLALSLSSGTQVLTAASGYTGATTISGGTLTLRDHGALSSPTLNLNGGTLLLDNSGQGQNDRLSDTAAITLRVGSLVVQGNASAAVQETLGVLQASAGTSTVQVIPTSGQFSSLTFASLGSGAGAILFKGDHLGDAPGAGVANITFTNAPTLIGSGGTTGSPGQSILPRALGGNGDTFVTYGPNGIRPLGDAEYLSNLDTGANVTLAKDAALAGTIAVNSLRIANSETIDGAGMLQIASGMLLLKAGTALTMKQQAWDLGTVGAQIYGDGDLTVNGIITGSKANGLVKVGAGRLTLTGANTYSGPTSVTGGTVNVQNNLALGPNNSAAVTLSNTQLELQGSASGGLSIIKSLSMSGGEMTNLSGLNKWSGGLSFSATTVNVAAGALTLDAPITGYFTKRGLGDLTVTNSITSSIVGGPVIAEGRMNWTAPTGASATSLAIGDATLKIAPTGSETTATIAIGAQYGGSGTLSYLGNSRLELDRGTHANLLVSLGGYSGAPLSGGGYSTLMIAPSDGLAGLGSSEKLKLFNSSLSSVPGTS